jgi:methylated-DNA-[protein]-cysteine S-methyltransferase
MAPPEASRRQRGEVARHRVLDSPTGPFFVRCDADGAIETGWRDMLDGPGGGGRTIESLGDADPDLLPGLCERILLAMKGRRVDFDDVPTPSGTGFQRAVWNATRTVECGSTATYGELARRVGRPKAARAIGQAMRRNRLPIVIPCHRIIAAGNLGGFGGEGAGTNRWTEIKTALLAAERA